VCPVLSAAGPGSGGHIRGDPLPDLNPAQPRTVFARKVRSGEDDPDQGHTPDPDRANQTRREPTERGSSAVTASTLRALVTGYATEAAVTAPAVEQFAQAVNQVATNAIEHGGGSGVLRVWTDPQAMVCEVSDTGAGLRDPLAGHLPAGRSTARGRGLCLARQLCDLLEVPSDPAGTTVRLHLTLP
jgi:anti-sigma regulatory factor (Ser/Thr protein kinase)